MKISKSLQPAQEISKDLQEEKQLTDSYRYEKSSQYLHNQEEKGGSRENLFGLFQSLRHMRRALRENIPGFDFAS